jgi:hypothetical protein
VLKTDEAISNFKMAVFRNRGKTLRNLAFCAELSVSLAPAVPTKAIVLITIIDKFRNFGSQKQHRTASKYASKQLKEFCTRVSYRENNHRIVIFTP